MQSMTLNSFLDIYEFIRSAHNTYLAVLKLPEQERNTYNTSDFIKKKVKISEYAFEHVTLRHLTM